MGIDGANSGDSFGARHSRRTTQRTARSCTRTPSSSTRRARTGFYDIEQIEQLVREYYDERDMRRIAMDPARLLLTAQHLQKKWGVPVESFAQSDSNMGAASAYLLTLVDEGRLRIHGPDSAKLIEHTDERHARHHAGAWGWRSGKDRLARRNRRLHRARHSRARARRQRRWRGLGADDRIGDLGGNIPPREKGDAWDESCDFWASRSETPRLRRSTFQTPPCRPAAARRRARRRRERGDGHHMRGSARVHPRARRDLGKPAVPRLQAERGRRHRPNRGRHSRPLWSAGPTTS